MKKKIIFSVIIFILLLLSVIFANSYVQAVSKQEKLQITKEMLNKEVENNRINEEEAEQIYRNIEERIENCYNYCEQNLNCQRYEQNTGCMRQNQHCPQKNYNCKRDCSNQYGGTNSMYNR